VADVDRRQLHRELAALTRERTRLMSFSVHSLAIRRQVGLKLRGPAQWATH
jgi:hypothetical protein